MFKQYRDFDVKNFGKIFITNPAYNRRLNGFDVMIMQEQSEANEIIEEVEKMLLLNKSQEDIEEWINYQLMNISNKELQFYVIEQIHKLIG